MIVQQAALEAVGIIKEATGEGDDGSWVAVIVQLLITVGVIVTATLGYFGLKRAGAAKDEAIETRSENRMDHGRVADALLDLRNEIAALSAQSAHRFDQLGQSIGDVREAHVRHLEWHIDKPKEGS